MKWAELNYNDFYIPFDDNQRAIRGFWLTTLGIDLENMPTIFREPFKYIEDKNAYDNHYTECKVYLSDIVGTSYRDYGAEEIIKSYMKIKRATHYISKGCVTRNKYFHMLKKPTAKQECPIILSKSQNGTHFVSRNGNHRIVFYKMMMLAEIALKYPYTYDEDYDLSFKGFNDVRKKYWLNVLIPKVNIL